MPEGDTILRAATTLRDACLGYTVQQVAHLKQPEQVAEAFQEGVASQKLVDVEARGKHLLMLFESGASLHSHMGMTGSWHLYEIGHPWKKPEKRAAASLHFSHCVAVCFSPKIFELLSARERKRHAHLNRLGPDILSESFCVDEVLRRFRVHNESPLGEVVLNQTVVCGIGNVYKSEMLFLEKLDPFAKVAVSDDATLLRLITTTREWMQRNLDGQPRRTRAHPSASRMWVYGRQGRHCFTCSRPIRMRRQGDQGRSTYWCPSCQGG